MHTLGADIATVVFMLGAGLLVAIAADRLRIPPTVGLLVVGLIAGAFVHIHLPFSFETSLLFVFLPPLVFEAAWNMDARALQRRWRTIVFLAVPGVALTAALVGFAVAATGTMPLAAALVLGSIIAATDPVAVISIFRTLHVPTDLATIVEGESLANDGVALVLFHALTAFAIGSEHASVGRAVVDLVVAVLGGVAIGAACAALVALISRGIDDGALLTLATIVLAYGGYVAAEHVGVSGIFACATAGIVLRAFIDTNRLAPRPELSSAIDTFWGAVALVVNSLVFLAMGAVLDLSRIVQEPLAIAVTLVVVFLARGAISYPLRIPRAWQHVVALSGIRGGLAIALALSLPPQVPARELILNATFAVVLVTLVPQGLLLGPILARLNLEAP